MVFQAICWGNPEVLTRGRQSLLWMMGQEAPNSRRLWRRHVYRYMGSILPSGFGFSQDCPAGVSWLVEEAAVFPRQGVCQHHVTNLRPHSVDPVQKKEPRRWRSNLVVVRITRWLIKH